MHIITGATGHVGSAVVRELRASGESVLAVTHSAKHRTALESAGAEVAVTTINDIEALTEIFRQGTSLFLLNPPGDVTKDSVKLEQQTVYSLTEALKSAPLAKVVVQSTQGAQCGHAIGDLGVLWTLEEKVKSMHIPASITRAGFYMSNWDLQLDNAKNGFVESFFPRDFTMPMAAPEDIGKYNAQKLLGRILDIEINNFSGPADYSANDVARAFSRSLNHSVEVKEIPESQWVSAYQAQGFSEISAKSYARMSRIAFHREYEVPQYPVRGTTTLDAYIRDLVAHVPAEI